MGNKYAVPRIPTPDERPGLKIRLENLLGILDPIVILPYHSFGTKDGLRLRGRVVEERELKGSREEPSTWRNVLNMIQRFRSDEIPGARVQALFQDRTWETRTDKEGFFVLDLDLDEPLEPGWHKVRLELLETIGEAKSSAVFEEVLVPSPDADFVVVSDLDDTVVVTRNPDFLQQIAIVFGNDAGQRVPFPGVPALYRALRRGPNEESENPIFYVSNSGWNIYDLFDEFLKIHDIPKGPLFMSDIRFIEEKSRVLGSEDHKFENTDLLLRMYPDQDFILIGDSGMHDPEIYLEIVRHHPGRVRAIYIHDVSAKKRDREVDAITRELSEEHDVPLVHSDTTADVAEHAAELGLISRAAHDEVRREVAQMPADNSRS